MSTPHILPVENATILGMCIDGDNTKSHEDLIRITKRNNFTQIDIAVVVPPVKIVPLDRLYASLYQLIKSNDMQQLLFLDMESRIRYSFNSLFPRAALVATYIVDNQGELIFEELMLSQAIGMMRSFSQYSKSPDAQGIIEDLTKVLETKPGIKSHVKDVTLQNAPKSYDPGYRTTLIATQLFNSTCRVAAKKVDIPMIRRPALNHGDSFFLLNDGLAKCSGCLRDATAFVNASNMVSYLSGNLRLPFSKEFLMASLPIKKPSFYQGNY
jgi:hypothetical protein